MKKYYLFLLFTLFLLTNSCSMNKNTDMLQFFPLALAGTGGYIGYKEMEGESKDKQMLVTGAAAASGYVLGKFIEGAIKNDMVSEFNAGYSLGTSNAAKTQYWIIQKRQQEDDYWNSASQQEYKLYSFPGAEYDPEGVKLVPHDVIIRTIQ